MKKKRATQNVDTTCGGKHLKTEQKNRKKQCRNLRKKPSKQLLKFMCEIGGGGDVMMLKEHKTNSFSILFCT